MKGNILLIEDDVDQADYLKLLLENEGYAVRWASNGDEAMRELSSKETKASMIFLDL